VDGYGFIFVLLQLMSFINDNVCVLGSNRIDLVDTVTTYNVRQEHGDGGSSNVK
jgi:hypothetical protein